MPAQGSGASWDAGGEDEEEEEEEQGARKPEPESGRQARANGPSPRGEGRQAPPESSVQRPPGKSPKG